MNNILENKLTNIISNAKYSLFYVKGQKMMEYCITQVEKHSDHIICHKVVDGNVGPLRRFNTNKIIDILRQ